MTYNNMQLYKGVLTQKHDKQYANITEKGDCKKD